MAINSLADNISLINPQTEMDKLISSALHCLEVHLRYQTEIKLDNSNAVRAYVRLQLAQEQEEVFAGLFFTNQHQLISFEKLFFGTINETAVYPRKIVKRALQHNAAKLVIAHNHPSQLCIPSCADKHLTQKIKRILDIIDVELIDHIIVCPQETYSFAEHGLLGRTGRV